MPWTELIDYVFGEEFRYNYLSDYDDRNFFHNLIRNESIPWSIRVDIPYVDENTISYLIKNPSAELLTLSEELIERYIDEWDWESLSANKSLTLSEELIERYIDKWNWKILSANDSLTLSEELIERYIDKWNWKILSANEFLPWSEKLIERYQYKWDWGYLSNNSGIPWSEALIERYEDKWKWSWEYLSRNESLPKFLPWYEELMERCKDKWDWGEILSSNGSLPLSEELIERFADKWEFMDLSHNEDLPWSEALIERYKDKWDWKLLSANKSLPWSEALIERYKDKWNWGEEYPDPEEQSKFKEEFGYYKLINGRSKGYSKNDYKSFLYGLSGNNFLPWSEALIERFADKWKWGYLEENKSAKIIFSSWAKQEISTALERIRSFEKETAKSFRLIAMQGNADAQCSLGYMYYEGRGVLKDYKEAIKLFKLAAEQGNADAQYWLGYMYWYGLGVPEDHEEAIKLFKLAAEQGHLDANYGLKFNFRS